MGWFEEGRLAGIEPGPSDHGADLIAEQRGQRGPAIHPGRDDRIERISGVERWPRPCRQAAATDQWVSSSGGEVLREPQHR